MKTKLERQKFLILRLEELKRKQSFKKSIKSRRRVLNEIERVKDRLAKLEVG
jgi:hypothetical protein